MAVVVQPSNDLSPDSVGVGIPHGDFSLCSWCQATVLFPEH